MMKVYLCLFWLMVGCVDARESTYHQKLACDPTLACIQTPDTGSEVGACPCNLTDPVSTPLTIQIPIVSPINDAVFPGRFLATNGPQGVAFQIPSLPIGATITDLMIRVKDNLIGPTKLYMSIVDQFDNHTVLPYLPSPSTLGTGDFQTLSLNGLSTVVTSGHTYHGGVFVEIPGTAPCGIYAAEVTYR